MFHAIWKNTMIRIICSLEYARQLKETGKVFGGVWYGPGNFGQTIYI